MAELRERERQKGAQNAFCAHCVSTKWSFYQDRLGTNMRKTLNTEVGFIAEEALARLEEATEVGKAKCFFFTPLCTKNSTFYPRQARYKHRESTQKKRRCP